MTRRLPPLATIHFTSLGCAKNRVDSEVMAAIAVEAGLRLVAEPTEADVLVVNTCGFVESAREESVGVLLDRARERSAGRCRMLVATGCMVQRHAAELAAELPEVDHFLGTTRIEELGAILRGRAGRLDVGDPGSHLQERHTPRFVEPGAVQAYLKIADGCARRCAFCAIPLIRGTAHSRPLDDLVEEARRLVGLGVRELDLVAQDSSAYGRDRDDGADLPTLLGRLDALPGVFWVRVLYLYPDAVDDRLLDALASLDKVVPYLDVPIQHASANVLRRMRRGHGPRLLAELFARARRRVPAVTLRTTVLVGHPGETAGDFQTLVGFIEHVGFDRLGAFRFSPEAGTHAATLADPVPRGVAYRRLRKVLAVQRRISRARQRALLGGELTVLVEGPADDRGLVLVGRHAGQAPEIDGVTYLTNSDAQVGDFVRARVVKVSDHDLVAEALD